jgi:hypothetical protein
VSNSLVGGGINVKGTASEVISGVDNSRVGGLFGFLGNYPKTTGLALTRFKSPMSSFIDPLFRPGVDLLHQPDEPLNQAVSDLGDAGMAQRRQQREPHLPGRGHQIRYLRAGHELVITGLSWMARSVRHLTEVAALLAEREVDLVVLKRGINISTLAGGSCST